MIATLKHRSLVASTLLVGALFIQTGCAGSDKEQEAELATDSSQGDATEAQAEEATTEAQAAPSAEAAPTPEAPAAAPSTPPAEATAAAPAPTAVSTPADGKARVVRYVSTKEAVLRSAPNDKAAKVGVLPKGERVMVIEENGWGRVSDDMFIKLNSLSAKAVPRKREKASWSKPAR